jgi:hypothetical protein
MESTKSSSQSRINSADPKPHGSRFLTRKRAVALCLLLLLITTPIALVQRYRPVTLTKKFNLTRLNATRDHWWLKPLFFPIDSQLPYIAPTILSVAHDESAALWIGGESGFLATMDDHDLPNPGPWRCFSPQPNDDTTWGIGTCMFEQLQTSQSVTAGLASFSIIPKVFAENQQPASAYQPKATRQQANAPPKPNTAPTTNSRPTQATGDSKSAAPASNLTTFPRRKSTIPIQRPQLTPKSADQEAGGTHLQTRSAGITTNADLIKTLNLTPEAIKAAVDKSHRYPNVIAIQWFGKEGEMLTDSAILYRTFNAGTTWYPYPISLAATKSKLELIVKSPVSEVDGALSFVLAGQTFQYDPAKEGISPVSSSGRCDEEIHILGKANASAPFVQPNPQCVIRPFPLRAWSTQNPNGEHGLWLLTQDNPGGRRLIRARPSRLGYFSLRLPPPWYLFIALPLAGSLLYIAAMRIPLPPPANASIANLAVSDRPLEWDDADALGLHSIARGLSLFLRNINTGVPLVVSISGPWGSGKSSLMNLLAACMKDVANTITFNAWHHQSEDQLLAALLQTVRTQGLQSVWSIRGVWRRLQLLLIKNSRALPAATFLLGLLVGSASIVIITTWTFLWSGTSQSATPLEQRLMGEAKYVIAALIAFLALLKTAKDAVGSVIANPASLLVSGSGARSLRDLDSQTTFRQRFARDFRNLTKVLGKRRIVIIIDDLDRCRPEKIREVLEAVNFLISSGECFVVLGLARRNIEYYLGESFSRLVRKMPADLLGVPIDQNLPADKSLQFARLYLDKLIQIDVPVPVMSAEQAREMIAGAEAATKLTLEERLALLQTQLHAKRVKKTREILLWIKNWCPPIVTSTLLTLALGQSIIRWDTTLLNRLAPSPHVKSSPIGSKVTQEEQPGSKPTKPLVPASAAENAAGSVTGKTAPVDTSTASRQQNAGVSQRESVGTSSRAVQSITAARSLPRGITYPIVGLLVMTFVIILLRLAFEDKESLEIDDKEDFKVALNEWAPLIYLYFQSPRSLKRYLNKVRFIASRQRGLYEMDGVQRIDKFAEMLTRLWERIWYRKAHAKVPQRIGGYPDKPVREEIPDRVLVILVALECDERTWKALTQCLSIPDQFFRDSGRQVWWNEKAQEPLLILFRGIWPDLIRYLATYRELAGTQTDKLVETTTSANNGSAEIDGIAPVLSN